MTKFELKIKLLCPFLLVTLNLAGCGQSESKESSNEEVSNMDATSISLSIPADVDVLTESEVLSKLNSLSKEFSPGSEDNPLALEERKFIVCAEEQLSVNKVSGQLGALNGEFGGEFIECVRKSVSLSDSVKLGSLNIAAKNLDIQGSVRMHGAFDHVCPGKDFSELNGKSITSILDNDKANPSFAATKCTPAIGTTLESKMIVRNTTNVAITNRDNIDEKASVTVQAVKASIGTSPNARCGSKVVSADIIEYDTCTKVYNFSSSNTKYSKDESKTETSKEGWMVRGEKLTANRKTKQFTEGTLQIQVHAWKGKLEFDGKPTLSLSLTDGSKTLDLNYATATKRFSKKPVSK